MGEEFTDLINALNSRDPAQRCQAAERLARDDSAARVAAIPLVRASGDGDETVREWAVAALEELGSPPATRIDGLAALLGDPHPDVGYWAATLLGRLGPEAATTTADLAHAVTDSPHNAVQERAAWALGKIGSSAVTALPGLEEAAHSTNPRLAQLAQRSLDQIRKP